MTKVLELYIPKVKNNKKIYYEIILITNIKEYKKCYSKVYRRYSDFYKLNQRIKNIMKLDFPKKKFFNTQDVINERKTKFKIYLNKIIETIDKNNLYMDDWVKDVMSFLQDDIYK